jgi:flagellum-specific ATP synthase
VAVAVRGILDGQVVMEPANVERGRYPAVDVLKTLPRTMPRATDRAFVETDAWSAKGDVHLCGYGGVDKAWRPPADRLGTTREVDEAIAMNPPFEAFLHQGKEEFTSMRDGYRGLAEILSEAIARVGRTE